MVKELWKSERKFGNSTYKLRVELNISPRDESKAVTFSAFSIGPRGGIISNGHFALSIKDWLEINNAISSELKNWTLKPEELP